MSRTAKILDRLPVFAISATALYGLYVTHMDSPAMSQAAMYTFLLLSVVLAPLAQATGLDRAPNAVTIAIVFVALFLVLAAIELVAMRLLKGRSSNVRWIVRLSALLVFAAILFFTPAIGPGRLF